MNVHEFNLTCEKKQAWFVNPGNRWNIPMTNGYQSDLLLSDRLIVTAVITLNDGGGNILRRRLMSFSSPSSLSPNGQSLQPIETVPDENSAKASARSLLQTNNAAVNEYLSVPLTPSQAEPDDGMVRDALQQISQQPRTGSLPAFQYNIDIIKAMTDIYGVDDTKSFNIFDFVLYGR